jgi:hypothetical protein
VEELQDWQELLKKTNSEQRAQVAALEEQETQEPLVKVKPKQREQELLLTTSSHGIHAEFIKKKPLHKLQSLTVLACLQLVHCEPIMTKPSQSLHSAALASPQAWQLLPTTRQEFVLVQSSTDSPLQLTHTSPQPDPLQL